MTIFLVLISLVIAAPGVYLLADFLLWMLAGRVVPAQITGFQEKKDKGLRLPVVSFEAQHDGTVNASAMRIDRLSFLLNRPQEGEGTMIVYRQSDPQQVRVYGYINVVGGLVLLVPLMAALAHAFGDTLVLIQIKYSLVFIAIIFGGWVLLKLIQRS